MIEDQIREAIEAGKFDDLRGKGKPVDLTGGLDATLRRILRDNEATHPVLEARRAIETELEASRSEYVRDRHEKKFRQRIQALNREIKLFNLKSPIQNFHLQVIDTDAEIRRLHETAPR